MAPPSLRPSLRDFPGLVLRVSPEGTVTSPDQRLRRRDGREVADLPLEELFRQQSCAELRRLLDAGDRGAEDGLCSSSVLDLELQGAEGAGRRRFLVLAEGEGPGRGLWLIELSPGMCATEGDATFLGLTEELENAKRDLARKSAHLTRMVEEIERKLEENERLSSLLQYQNEEVEKRNEELLGITQALHAGQEKLLQANQQLETRTRQLQVALSARNRFYAAMSHELRTPINAVMGYNDLLLAGVYGPLSERQELAIERSQRAVRHLRALVNDVLDISSIELGRMEIVAEPVELRQLLDSLFVALRPLAESRGSTLHLGMGDCPAEVVTDPRCLRQILLNVVSTSLRLAAGAPIWVQCSRDPSGVAIEVTDDGGGLSGDDLEEAFEEFASLGDSTLPASAAGTGLGLPVARRLAALLGGRLEASTTRGVGNLFRLTLPVAAVAAPGFAGMESKTEP